MHRTTKRGSVRWCLAAGAAAVVVAGHAAAAQSRAVGGRAGQRSAKPPAAPTGPRYAPVRQEVDAGKVRRGATARFEFIIRNPGTQTLRLEVKPNCNCTVPTYDREIAPGAQGKVVAELHTIDLSGYTTKTLSVKTNDPKRPSAGLYLIATVVSMAEVIPSESFVFPLRDEGPTVRDVTIRLQKGETAEITGAVSTVPGVKAALEQMPESDGRRAYRLALTALETMPLGAINARITLKTTSVAEPEIRIKIRCEKGIIATPPSVYLGVIPPKPPEPLARIVMLSRHSGPFRVLRISSSDQNIRAEFVKVQGAGAYRITVRYSSGWQPGWVQQLLTVETDNTRQPRLLIPVLARVTDGRSSP